MKEWLTILLFTDAFLLLFVGADLIYKKNILKADHTRNVVHAGSGLIALFFPFFIKEIWPVAILCTSFLLLLIVTKKMNLFGAVNAVERKTYGSVLYPVVVFIVFYKYAQVDEYHQFAGWPFRAVVLYYLPISIMAFADPAAALTGKYFGNGNRPGKKTIYGSIAFATVACMLSAGVLTRWNNGQSDIGITITSILVTTGTTAAEYWSKKGWDNLTVPLVALIILSFSIELPF